MWDMEAAVATGAAMLDRKLPNWYTTVHGKMTEGLFRMKDWDRCIAGSLELIQYLTFDAAGNLVPAKVGDFSKGRYIVFNGVKLALEEHAHRFGFNTPEAIEEEDDDMLDQMEKIWRKEIDARLAVDKIIAEHEPEAA